MEFFHNLWWKQFSCGLCVAAQATEAKWGFFCVLFVQIEVHEQSVSHCSYHILRRTAGDILSSCGLGNINEVDE